MWFIGKLSRNKRGAGSIVGAVFILLILLTGFTFYILNVNVTEDYTKTVQDVQQLDLKRNKENIEFISVSFNEDTLNITVRNTGSYNAHLIWLGIFDQTVSPTTQGYYKINFYVNPAETVPKIRNETIPTFEGEERVIQLVTELGNTFSYSYPEEGERYDFVHKNTSNVDTSDDKGTHSFFSAQQYGPDGICDTLTEENAGSWGDYPSELLVNPGAEFGNTTGWTATGPNAANFAAGYDCPAGSAGPRTGSYAFYWNSPSSSDDWAYQEADLSPWRSEIQVGEAQIIAKGWLVCSEYHDPPWDIVRMKVVFYDNSSQEISSATYDTGERGDLQAWTEFGIENYTIPTNAVKVRIWFQTFENGYDAGNADDFTVKVRTRARNYELDLEVQWTNADCDETNEWLCIYGGTMSDSEDILVDVWNGTDWITVFTDLSSGWNSVDVSSYLISPTFTIRFRDGTKTDDTTQDSWEIDATFLHVWT